MERLALPRLRLEDHLEAALEIQAEGHLLVYRRTGDRERHHARECERDPGHQEQILTTVCHERLED